MKMAHTTNIKKVEDKTKSSNKNKSENKTKVIENVILLLMIILAILTFVQQGFDKCKSDFDNKILGQTLDVNTKLIDAFRFQLFAFNSEYNTFTGVCNSPLNSSIVFDTQNSYFAPSDKEDTLNNMYKLGIMDCQTLLNMKRRLYLQSYQDTFTNAVLLNQNISKIKQKGTWCETSSRVSYFFLILVSLLTVFLYVKLIKRIRSTKS